MSPDEMKRLNELDFLVEETFASPDEFTEYCDLRRRYRDENSQQTTDLAVRTALNGAL